jgi:hypothetical protein
MRTLLSLLAVGLLGLLLAGTAPAAQIDWHGTLETKLGAAKRFNADGSRRGLRGSGVATVNGSGGGLLLNSLRLAGGITGTAGAPVTDPDTVGTIPTIIVTGTLGSGTLADFANPPLAGGSNTLPIHGQSRVCLLNVNCTQWIPLPFSNGPGNNVGVGGQMTAGGAGNIRISIIAGPWTVGSGAATNNTEDGGYKTVTATGFIHGPASGTTPTSNTLAQGSGVVQLISPMQVITTGIAGNSAKISLFSIMTLHFIPEPGLLLLLGSGIVGLGILGRNRIRR